MTHDDRAAHAAVGPEASPDDRRDPIDEALRHLGEDILNEPLPESLLALLDGIPSTRRA